MNGYKMPHGMPVDAKLAVIAKKAGIKRGEALALWVALLDHASQNMPRGSVANIVPEEIAVMLEFDAAMTEAALQAFHDKGMISQDGLLTSWEKSQTLSSTLRTREYRSRRQQDKKTMPEKECGDDPESETTQRRQRLCGQITTRHKKRGRAIAKPH